MIAKRQPIQKFNNSNSNSNNNHNINNCNSISSILQGKKFYFDPGVNRQEDLRDLINSHGGKKELSLAQSNYYVCEKDTDIKEIIEIPIINKSYLISCLDRKRPMNEELIQEYRLDTSIFEGFVVATSGYEEIENEMKHIVTLMSGQYSYEVTSETTHLISKNVLSKKTADARNIRDRDGRPKIKVVTNAWLNESYRCNRDLTEEYIIPIFYGGRICLSGFDTFETRSAVQNGLTQNGALYQANLKQSVQVLISNGVITEKYKKAWHWGKPIVSEQWFHDSIKYGYAQELDYYRCTVEPPPESQNDSSFSATNNGSAVPTMVHHPTPMPRNIPSLTPASFDSQQFHQHQTIPPTLPPSYQQPQQNLSQLVLPSQYIQRPPGNQLIQQQQQQQQQSDCAATQSQQKQLVLTDNAAQLDKELFRDATIGMLGFEGDLETKMRSSIDQCSNFIEYSTVPQTAYSTPCILHYLMVNHGNRYYRSDAKKLTGTQVITLQWFSDCHRKRRILPFDFVHYQPLKEINFMPEVCVTVSGFARKSEEFVYTRELSRLLGAKFLYSLKRDVTHLVTLCGTSKKYQRAKEWGLKIVTLDWLTKCAKDGRRVPEEDYLVQEGSKHTWEHAVVEEQPQQTILLDAPPTAAAIKNTPHRGGGILVKKNPQQPMMMVQSPIMPQTISMDNSTITPSLPISCINNSGVGVSSQLGHLLKGVNIFLSETLKLDLKTQLTVWIEKMGGVVASDHFSNITHYLTERIDMEEKRKILGNCKAVAPEWLKDSFYAHRVYDEELYQPLLPEKKLDEDDNEHGIVHSLSREPKSQLFTGSAPDSLRQKGSGSQKDIKEEETGDEKQENRTDSSKPAVVFTQPQTQPSSIGKIVAALELLPSQSQFAVPNPKTVVPSKSSLSSTKKGVKRSNSGAHVHHHHTSSSSSSKKSSMSIMDIENLAEGVSEDGDASGESDDDDSSGDENSQRVTYGDNGVKRKRRDPKTPPININANNSSTTNITTTTATVTNNNNNNTVNNTNTNTNNNRPATGLAEILKGTVKWILFSAFDVAPSAEIKASLQSTAIGFRMCESAFIVGKTSHLITPTPKRSEKYMAACAAGAWILVPSFVDACIQQQKCVEETDYEWTRDMCDQEKLVNPQSTTLSFAQAARNCRMAVAQKNRPIFSKAVFRVTSYPDPKKSLDLWCDIIRAGGGTIVMQGESPPPGTTITHALFKKNDTRSKEVEPNIKIISDSELTICLIDGKHLVD
ncbi:BRCT domain-containing protein [Cavenderia fasciculata]|uniref:BRCT domain-containing protein n=1 Tax=Cavenderia fasciculata TaxID=261658 RepID=F4Q6J7_CACFS|nr:BRCT domain-containing protein [Cavenderia fasciculata]EGG16507.1 BRCT domain-containing protein [Cavenderia fasciculata]|eukprot:XP_004354907.1 BRCT domain-containing protein [Cavenderia fasciculata]